MSVLKLAIRDIESLGCVMMMVVVIFTEMEGEVMGMIAVRKHKGRIKLMGFGEFILRLKEPLTCFKSEILATAIRTNGFKSQFTVTWHGAGFP